MSTYKNIGLLFNKHYFKGIDFKNYPETNPQEKVAKKNVIENNQQILKEKNTDLFSSKIDNQWIPSIPGELQTCKLTTIYPGLFSGSGYAHESSIEGELKLGFYFDYTSGLPCIPGSSVKGVLRQAFKHSDYIKLIIKELASGRRHSKLQQAFGECDYKWFSDGLLNDIFGEDETIASIYSRDIFFDAFPVSTKKGLLSNDYITPHPDPLKNPIPLQFMKVLPGVEFEFRFKLHPSNGLSIEMKTELFRQILLDFGIGAKTNVGYGQFDDGSEKKSVPKLALSGKTDTKSFDNNSLGINYSEDKGKSNPLKPGEVIATYIEPDSKIRNNVKLRIESEGNYKDNVISIRYPSGMNANQKVILTLNLDKKKIIQSATVKKIL